MSRKPDYQQRTNIFDRVRFISVIHLLKDLLFFRSEFDIPVNVRLLIELDKPSFYPWLPMSRVINDWKIVTLCVFSNIIVNNR